MLPFFLQERDPTERVRKLILSNELTTASELKVYISSIFLELADNIVKLVILSLHKNLMMYS